MSSVTCSREFTLTVNGGDTLKACYRFDEADGSTNWASSVGSNDLIQLGGLGSTAGKFNNAVTVKGSWTYAETAESADFDLGGKSVTVRFWVYSPENTEGGDTLIFELSNLGEDFQIWRIGGGSTSLNLQVDTVGDRQDITASGLNIGAWNRVIAWYEDGVGVGIKINNDAAVTAADVSGLVAGNRSVYIKIESVPVTLGKGPIDDLSIWTEKLSDADMLADWNGGAGVSCCSDPLGYWKLDEGDGAIRLDDQTAGSRDFCTHGGVGPDNSNMLTTAGKIGGGATASAATSETYQPLPIDNQFACNGSFTIRFWFKLTSVGGYASDLLFSTTGTDREWIYINSADAINYQIEWVCDTDTDGCDLYSDNLTPNTWQRVIVWFEDGVGFGIKLDNNAAITQASATSRTLNNTHVDLYMTLRSWHSIDEVGVWDHKWTDAEMLADWNSGAGKTYP